MQRIATILGGVTTILLTTYLLDSGWEALFELADPLRLGITVGGLIAAIFVGELGRLLRLPRVVGYLAVGVILGPVSTQFAVQSSIELPRLTEVFSGLGAIFSGALALTGLAVGLRFQVQSVTANVRRVVAPAILVLLAGVAALTPATLLLDRELQLGLFDGDPTRFTVSLFLVGLLVVTSGVSAIWATDAEFKVEGTHAEAELQIALVKDSLIAAAILAIVATQLFELGTEETYSGWLTATGGELAFTLLSAVLAGFVLLATLRWIPRQIVPMGVILATLTGLVASDSPGLAFLGAIFAGAMVTSSSKLSHAIADSLDRGSPVTLSIVFLQLGLLLELPVETSFWLAAVGLAVLRLVVFLVAAAMAERLAFATDAGRHHARALLAQGIGPILLAIWVSEQLADPSVLLLLGPVILIDTVLGTIVHRAYIARAAVGRPRGFDHEAPSNDTENAPDSPVETRRGGLDVDDSLLPPVNFEIPEFESPPLTQVAERVRSRLERTMERVAEGYFEPARKETDDLLDLASRTIRRHVRDTSEAIHRQTEPKRRIDLLRSRRTELDRTFLELIQHYGHYSDDHTFGATLDDIARDLQRTVELPTTIQAPELLQLSRPTVGDTAWIAARKAIHRISSRLGPAPPRSVPVRRIGTEVLAHGVVARLESAANMIGHHRLYVWHKIELAWSQLDEMYARSLNQIDEEQDRFRTDTTEDEEAELIEFDRRLAEGEQARAHSRNDQTGTTAPFLKPEQSSPDDAVSAYWQGKLQEISLESEQLHADARAFEHDTRRRMALAFSASFQDFVWALRRSGTFLLPSRSLEPRGVTFHVDSEERARSAARHWHSLVGSHLDQRAMHLQLRILQSDIHPIIDELVNKTSRELASRLTYYPAETSERCRDIVALFGESIAADTSASDLLDAVIQVRSSLSEFLQDDAMQSLNELRQSNRFSDLLAEFVHELEQLIARQPDIFSIPSVDLLTLEETESAEHVEQVSIPFRQILERSFVATVSASLNELDRDVFAMIDRVSSGLGEINRVISFNLDAAASELRSVDGDDDKAIDLAAEFVVGGLHRAGLAAGELLTSTEGAIDQVESALIDVTVTHLNEAKEILLDTDVFAIAERAHLSSSSPIPVRGRDAFDRVREFARKTFVSTFQPITKLIQSTEERFSFDDGSYEDLRALGPRASFDSDHLERLPNSYRRLFAPVSVDIPEIFVDRPEAHSRIKSVIDRWRSGTRTSIVVTGELGSGRTSFLHRMLAEDLSDIHVVRWSAGGRVCGSEEFAKRLGSLLALQHVFDPDQFVEALSDITDPRLILIDGLEQLYLRSNDGSGAVRTLADLVSRSPPNILWVISCSPTLYTHLATRLGSDDLFTDRVDLPRLGRDQLEEMIMRRHRVSGYRLVFVEHDDENEEVDKLELNEKAQKKRKRRFFDRLHHVSLGHPIFALYLWLDSVGPTDAEETLMARPVCPLRSGYLRHLGIERLISLGQFVLHHRLTETEFAEAMRLDLDHARRRLSFLESLGLLERTSGRRDLFQVNEVLFLHIYRAIHDRNVV